MVRARERSRLVWFGACIVSVLVLLDASLGRRVVASTDRSRDGTERTGSVRGRFTSLQRLLTRGATSQRDVVIYLKSEAPAKHAPPAVPVEVIQRKLRFEPHVLPVLQGTPVRFVNKDDVDHNVFSNGDCCRIDVDMSPRSAAPFTFERAGAIPIICRLHPEMSLWIIVLPEPWFTRVELEKTKDEGGRRYEADYSIKDVPPGEYTLTFWNKKLKPREYSVVVSAGAETALDIEIAE